MLVRGIVMRTKQAASLLPVVIVVDHVSYLTLHLTESFPSIFHVLIDDCCLRQPQQGNLVQMSQSLTDTLLDGNTVIRQ